VGFGCNDFVADRCVPERESIEELQDVAYVLLFEVEATIYSRVSMDFVAPPCFFVVIGYMFYPRPGILAPIIQLPDIYQYNTAVRAMPPPAVCSTPQTYRRISQQTSKAVWATRKDPFLAWSSTQRFILWNTSLNGSNVSLVPRHALVPPDSQ
jgi:hypothetical protein